MKNSLFIFISIFMTINMFGQNALNFDGLNDRVDCGNASAVQLSGTTITLEAWVKPSSFGPNVWSNNIIDKESWTPQNGYMLRCGSNGKVNFNLGVSNSWNELTSSVALLTVNTWTHVAATYDGSYMRIYINGVCTDSIAKTISFSNASSNNLVIGDNSQMGRNFAGLIDEVRIWNVARTKVEIQAGMNTEFCGGAAGLRAYYKFNQGIASGNNAAITTAINSSIMGSNAVLSGFTLNGSTSNFVLGKSLTPATGGSADSVYATLCSGNSYSFNGQQLTTAGTYNATFSSANGCDSIVTLFLSVIASASSYIYDTICKGESYILGNQTLTSAGVYSEVYTAANGCDSTVTLALAVRTVNVDVTVVSGSISANLSGVQYQWLNCPTLDTVGLGGAQSQVLFPKVNGSYAVIINDHNCIDTSDCHIVLGVGMREYTNEKSVKIFPNPSNGIFQIEFSNQQILEFQLFDVLGQEIMHSKIKGRTALDLSQYDRGIYYLYINQEFQMHKLILE